MSDIVEIRQEFATRVIDGRFDRPKTYTQRKINRLVEHHKVKPEDVLQEPCLTTVYLRRRKQAFQFFHR